MSQNGELSDWKVVEKHSEEFVSGIGWDGWRIERKFIM